MRGTLFARMEQILASIIAVCFVWSVFNVTATFGIVNPALDDPNSAANKLWGFTLSMLFAIYFPLNAFVAMERLFIVQRRPPSETRKHFLWGSLAVLPSAVTLTILPLVCPNYSVDFVNLIPAYIWQSNWDLLYLVSVGVMLGCYVSTYRESARLLREALRGSSKRESVSSDLASSSDGLRDNDLARVLMDSKRIKIERHVLLSCVLMSSTMILFYIPSALLLNLATFAPNTLNFDDASSLLIDDLSNLIMGLDYFLAPLFIIWFSRDIRFCLLCCRSRKGADSGKV
ncbi:hypothetical protein BC830DRAFT_1168691 [Chytriomyces sp. MP71]|nr:hypothetical protein BC830DRAFT_1168691 [Chytriomyces sp. MP71]